MQETPGRMFFRSQGRVRSFVKNPLNFLIASFFLILLLAGISIHDDYGLTYDEEIQRTIGVMNARYITGESKDLLSNHHRIYGPFFEIILVGAEGVFQVDRDDTRSIFQLRHLLTFLAFFVSTIAFYLTGLELFKNKGWAWLGTVFLVLSPRIFAHSFYNSKDLAFLALWTIATYSLVKFIKEDKSRWIVVHALCTAWAVDTRVMGIFIPVLTVALVGFQTVRSGAGWMEYRRPLLTKTGSYLALTVILTVLFWPFLWSNPVQHFAEAFREMKSYPWPGTVLYRGEYIKATDLPWHYIPVWMAITTPLAYSFGFIMGSALGAWRLVRSLPARSSGTVAVENFVPLFLFWGPLLAVILSGATLYDGWRHMFYIYPAFILLSVGGYKFLAEWLTRRMTNRGLKLAKGAAGAAVFIYLLAIGNFMIQYHPHQNVYFNRLAGPDMATIKSHYELDYWGGSYKQGLEYIVKNDPSDVIHYYADQDPGYFNRAMLPAEDRSRLKMVSSIEEADYFLTTFRWHPESFPYPEFHSITMGNAGVLTIYRPHTVERK